MLCDFTQNYTLSRRILLCQVFARLLRWSTDDIMRGACPAVRVGLGLKGEEGVDSRILWFKMLLIHDVPGNSCLNPLTSITRSE